MLSTANKNITANIFFMLSVSFSDQNFAESDSGCNVPSTTPPSAR
jgi:hypothetical protein